MQKNIPGALRRTLLLKVISKPQPTREDVNSVIELTCSKVVEALNAQSMSLYLIEGDQIAFKWVYYSPSLWKEEPEREAEFDQKRETLLNLSLPKGTGIVGQVINSGKPLFFSPETDQERMHSLARQTGFAIHSMLTVPLVSSGKVIGAIQVLNKEPGSKEQAFQDSDLEVLTEVADYSASLILRMLDSNFKLSDKDTALFISRFTDNRLVLDEKELTIDEKLIEVVGDAIIRRTHILPYHRLSPSSVAVLMTNPMDFPSRESFQTATELFVEEVAVAPASLIEKRVCRRICGLKSA